MKLKFKGLMIVMALLLASLSAGSHAQQPTHGKALLQKDISSYAGDDLFLNVGEVTFLPAASVAKHRHPGPAFVYVLQGAVEIEAEGSAPKVYRAGESFYGDPHQLYIKTTNMSQTESAKLLVYVLSRKGEPPTEMEK